MWNRKGNILCFLKKYEESQQCYDKVKELNPNDYENALIWYERGIIFYQLKVYEEAIQCYDKIIEICKKNHQVNIYTISHPRGMYNEAIDSYDKVIKKNPNNNTDLWYNKGLFLLKTRSHTSKDEYHNNKIEALKCYDKIIEINPNHAKAWIKKGLIYEKHLGISEGASVAAKISDIIENKTPNATFTSSDFQDFEDEYIYPDLIKFYDKAIEINSNCENNAVDVWLYLCYALAWRPIRYGSSSKKIGEIWVQIRDTDRQRQRLEKALDCLDKALECNSKYSDDPYIWASKGQTLFYYLGRCEEAIKYYDKALEIAPAYHDVLYCKQIALEKLGKDEDARKCFDQLKGIRTADYRPSLLKCDGTLLDDIVNEWW